MNPSTSITITTTAPSRFHLSARQTLPRPRAEVWAFFSDPRNLSQLTPPETAIRMLNGDGLAMKEGALIDYELRVKGLPLRWTSRIAVWSPPVRFVDIQLRGPYRSWIHQHLFEESPDGTVVGDEVDYQVPGGRWVHDLFVKHELRRIFAFRMSALHSIFGSA